MRPPHLVVLALALGGLLLGVAPREAAAQTIAPEHLDALEYRHIGPEGNRVNSDEVDAAEADFDALVSGPLAAFNRMLANEGLSGLTLGGN